MATSVGIVILLKLARCVTQRNTSENNIKKDQGMYLSVMQFLNMHKN